MKKLKNMKTSLLSNYINNYNIELKRAVLNNNELDDDISKISMSIDVKFSDIHNIGEMTFETMIKASVLGLNADIQEEDIFEEDDIEEKSVFNMECIYKVTVIVNSDIKYEEQDFKNIVWFLLHPTLNETINVFGRRLGLPNINLPYASEG